MGIIQFIRVQLKVNMRFIVLALVFCLVAYVSAQSCTSNFCQLCEDVFEDELTTYDCEGSCNNCKLCGGNYDEVEFCKYCKNGPENCKSLCKKGQMDCISCNAKSACSK